MDEFTEDQSSFEVSRWGDGISVLFNGPLTESYAKEIAARLAMAMCRPGVETCVQDGLSLSHGFHYKVTRV